MERNKASLDQLRARHTLNVVNGLGEADGPVFRRRVDNLGPAILTNGLGQALATTRAQDGGQSVVYDKLSDWLCRQHPYSPYLGEDDALAGIVRHGRSEYMWAEGETLEWLTWLKKLARARFPGASGVGND